MSDNETSSNPSEPGRLRLKLSGGLARTASWVELRPDGCLLVELYDHSDEAERVFGNDVAYLIYVAQGDLSRVCLALGLAADCNQSAAATLLQGLAERFADYYAVLRWLDAQAIPYRKEFDAWA